MHLKSSLQIFFKSDFGHSIFSYWVIIGHMNLKSYPFLNLILANTMRANFISKLIQIWLTYFHNLFKSEWHFMSWWSLHYEMKLWILIRNSIVSLTYLISNLIENWSTFKSLGDLKLIKDQGQANVIIVTGWKSLISITEYFKSYSDLNS